MHKQSKQQEKLWKKKLKLKCCQFVTDYLEQQ